MFFAKHQYGNIKKANHTEGLIKFSTEPEEKVWLGINISTRIDNTKMKQKRNIERVSGPRQKISV